MSKVAEFYDGFSNYMTDIGVNKRHVAIKSWLEKFGLKPEHSVLEIGCGIGQQTKILATQLNSTSRVLAVDISPKNIEIAKERCSEHKNVEFITADIVQYPMKEKFDVILLPDVLEHIPVDQHYELFKKIRVSLKDDGFVLIHIPNPYCLEYTRKHHPEKLQVIDQSIYTDIFVKNVYPNDLHIRHLETYTIWQVNGDYQVIVLKPNDESMAFPHVKNPPPSFMDKVKMKLGL